LKEKAVRKYPTRFILAVCMGLVASIGQTTPSKAETGSILVVFTKVGFVVGAGSGRGVLTFRAHEYPFWVSGMSIGATIGGSTNKLVGRALYLRSPYDIAGTYAAIGAGGALTAGAGGIYLQNAKGVVLQLKGVKVGMELSAAVSGIEITLK
jgi:lipid-binding SYLF domain-containing protein